VRVFKSRWFQRFARKEGIADAVLREAVARTEKGQVDADLGGEVIKQRIARPGQGRSKGYRAVIFFRRREDRPLLAGERTRGAVEERRLCGGKKRMSKRHKSDAMAAIHEMMEDLHLGGVIDKQTMRRFDDACLTPIRPLKPEEIKAIREKERVSQAVFANYLNVANSLVSKWERGEKRPSAAALKLLSLVEKNGLATVA
jgi:putative transcriptional regulator